MSLGVFVSAWIARYLGSEKFGLLNYAAAFSAIFLSVAALGLDNVVVRYLLDDSANKNQLLGTVFWLKLFGGIIALISAIGTAFLFSYENLNIVLLISILATAGLFQAFDSIDFFFQSKIQSKYTVIARSIPFLLVSAVRIALIKNGASVVEFSLAVLLEAILSALGLLICYGWKGGVIKLWRWNTLWAKKLLLESYPLIFAALSIIIYMKIDQLMLGKMVGEKAVGLYSAATRISEIWYFVPMVIVSSFSPSIYKAKKISEELYYEKIEFLIKLMMLLPVVISIAMTFVSDYLIDVVFGAEYIGAGSILAIHIWASVFVFMGVSTSPWFIAEELNHLSFQRTFIGAIVNVILNLILIPRYQGIGAAVATVISYAVAGLFSHAIHPRTRKIFRLQIRSILFFL